MKKYQIIYADPPWLYRDKSKSHGGGAESHYECMSVADICSLSVPSADDSILFLWATFPQLEEAFKVISAWGFTYKTGAFTWVKTNKDGSIYMGMGRHTRANAEVCLLAKKGKGLPRVDAGIYNTQLHSRSVHSKKPDKFRDDIVRLYGETTRLEMFARTKTPGWDVWGNEVESDITLPSPTTPPPARATPEPQSTRSDTAPKRVSGSPPRDFIKNIYSREAQSEWGN